MLLDPDEKICFSGDAIIEHLWMFLEESLPPEVYWQSLQHAVARLREAGIERIYNGHYAYKPLTLADTDGMLAGMEQICAGAVQGKTHVRFLSCSDLDREYVPCRSIPQPGGGMQALPEEPAKRRPRLTAEKKLL